MADTVTEEILAAKENIEANMIRGGVDDEKATELVAETTLEKMPDLEINLSQLENASVDGQRPHMDTLRFPAAAQALGLNFSPPSEVEGAMCEEMALEEITPDHIELTKKMLRLLAEINGLGLAAPQIGIKKRFMVYWDTRQNMPYVCYNPKYYPSKHQTTWAEKCLTYGELTFAVKRWREVQAVWWEFDTDADWANPRLIKKTKNLKGLLAEVFQHETDHLNGITIASGVLLR